MGADVVFRSASASVQRAQDKTGNTYGHKPSEFVWPGCAISPSKIFQAVPACPVTDVL